MRIAIVAGEASGDVLGAGLIEAIRTRVPHATFEGVAGPRMRAAGCDVLEDVEVLSVMGLVEPLKVLPQLLKLRRELVRRWTASPPDVMVGIDSPEFNLGLELRLRRRGVRTVQYVSPQVWAWRRGRVRKIGRAVDRVLCLLPFEKAFYDQFGVPAVVVGHPLADTLPADLDRRTERERLGLTAARVVTVLPGSRRGEVTRLGPTFVATAAQLQARYQDIQFIAPMANPEVSELFRAQLSAAGAENLIRVQEQGATEAIVAAGAVLLASGTVSLQTALLGRAMVSAYKVAAPTYYLARLFRLLKVDHFTMPNLLTPEPLVPEFLQHDANEHELTRAMAALLDDAPRRERIEVAFASLRETLSQGGDAKAADAVLDVAAS